MLSTLAKVHDVQVWARVGLRVVESGDGWIKVRARDGSWARIDQKGVRMWSPARGEAWLMKWKGSQLKGWFGTLLAEAVLDGSVELAGWGVVRGMVALALIYEEVGICGSE